MSIQQLRDQRVAVSKEYRNILDNNKGELTPEENEKLESLGAEHDKLEARINKEEKALSMQAEKLERESVADTLKGNTKDPEARELLNKWMGGGDRAISADEWAHINNTMSTTTDGEGGYTVQTDVAKSVMDALKAFGGMREAAMVIQTDQGNPMNWPTSDGTSEVGEIVAENVSATDDDISFGVKSLPVYKYSSKVVTVPIELLQDSSVNVEDFVNKRITQRLGRITNTHFTVGTGTGQPLGIMAAAAKGADASALTAIAFDELIDLEHSVDPAYRASSRCQWMFSDAVLKLLKKLKDGDNRPIWLPSLGEGAPASILNYKYTVNQDVAVPAASAKSVAFGDFDKYVIRDVMAVTYHRFTDSAYAKKGQVGFLAFMRSGGNYMDVGGAIKVLQHAAS